MATLKEQRKADRESAIEMLSKLLSEGQTIYTIVRHVSQSGLSRKMSFFIVNNRGVLQNITWYVAHALGERPRDWNGHRVLHVKGAGMDMAFATVYNLSYMFFDRDGYKLRSEII